MGMEDNRIAGSGGNWGKLPDPFDPGWRAAMDRTLHGDLADVLDDPWCLGLFVDNELHWGDARYLAEATLRSPSSQPAKQAFRAELERKYGTIERLNAAWGTKHASWTAWTESTSVPSGAAKDCQRGSRAVQSSGHRALFPGLPRGGEDCGAEASLPRCALRWRKQFRLAGRQPLLRCDQHEPLLCFGGGSLLTPGRRSAHTCGRVSLWRAGSRPLGSALVPVADQAARAVAYTEYVLSALRNPRIIGTHWFQYFDQPSSGRFDSENYQTGFVDTCDTPYAETITAARELGRRMYRVRVADEAAHLTP